MDPNSTDCTCFLKRASNDKNENGGDVEVKHQWVVSRGLQYLYIKLWKSKFKKVEKVGEKYTQMRYSTTVVQMAIE